MPQLNNHKIINATKWSAVAELLAKLITPISTIVLARLLTPDAFGIVATVTMIISFAEIGGYSNRARRTKAYIIYANGKVHPTCGGKVLPGCEIVVPSRPERERVTASQWIGIASASASLASVAATLTTLIINATKNNSSSK